MGFSIGSGGLNLGGVSLGGSLGGPVGDLMSAGNGLSGMSGNGGTWMDLIPGIGDSKAQREANETNVNLAMKQMRFQEMMSNSSYQRAMKDMSKAGLNPMLAFSQGGASVPAGASTTVSPAAKTKLAETAISAFTGVNSARMQQAQIDNQVQQTNSNIQLQNTQSAKNLAEMEKVKTDTAIQQRELKTPKVKDYINRKGTEILSHLMDNISVTAKDSKENRPVIRLFDKPADHAWKDNPNYKKTLEAFKNYSKEH